MRKTKRKRINQNKVTVTLSFLFMLTVGSCILLSSSIFKVKQIDVKGNKECTKQEIINDLGFCLDKNIFRNKTGDIKDKLMENSYIDKVEITRKLPDKLIVNIKERKPIALLRNNGKNCLIDDKGNFLKKVVDLDENKDKVVVDVDYYINKEKKIGFKNEHHGKRLFYLLECLKKSNVYKQIDKVDLMEKEDILIVSRNKVKILLPDNDRLDYNVSRLNSILVDLQNKNISNGTINLSYDKCAIYTPE